MPPLSLQPAAQARQGSDRAGLVERGWRGGDGTEAARHGRVAMEGLGAVARPWDAPVRGEARRRERGPQRPRRRDASMMDEDQRRTPRRQEMPAAGGPDSPPTREE